MQSSTVNKTVNSTCEDKANSFSRLWLFVDRTCQYRGEFDAEALVTTRIFLGIVLWIGLAACNGRIHAEGPESKSGEDKIGSVYDVFPEAVAPYYRVRFTAEEFGEQFSYGANFTAWVPPTDGPLRGVLVHQHGCGEGSCKSGLTGAYDLHWQALAKKHSCLLLSPVYEQPEMGDCQLWCDPRKGSAKVFLEALKRIAELADRPEIAKVPWALWGHSGGGHWCGGMALMYPDRVAAVWLRSGVPRLEPLGAQGNIASHSFNPGVLGVPFMCNVGTKEGVTVQDDRFASVWPATLEFFHNLRAHGGLIATSVDPLTSHECGNQRYLAIPWLDECLTLRLPSTNGQPLKSIDASRGWLAPSGGQLPAASDTIATTEETLSWSWLPSEKFSKLWTRYSKDSSVPDDSPPPAPTEAVRIGGVLRWICDADVESGLAQFVIERDGKEIARIPDKPNHSFGRPVFQGLQYSDTPPQPLAKMEYLDPDFGQAENIPSRTSVYSVYALNTVGKASEKTAFKNQTQSE